MIGHVNGDVIAGVFVGVSVAAADGVRAGGGVVGYAAAAAEAVAPMDDCTEIAGVVAGVGIGERCNGQGASARAVNCGDARWRACVGEGCILNDDGGAPDSVERAAAAVDDVDDHEIAGALVGVDVAAGDGVSAAAVGYGAGAAGAVAPQNVCGEVAGMRAGVGIGEGGDGERAGAEAFDRGWSGGGGGGWSL